MLISYNWLKWYIPEVPEVNKLIDIFNYHLCEMESLEKMSNGDTVFDIKVLPNRAHDLLSHQGMACELASLLNIKYLDPTPKYKIPKSKPTTLQIKVESEKCRRYMGRIIKGVKVGSSPKWVVEHLESIGQRSINNIVDAANLVMFDCGQPTHAFDLEKMDSVIIVREAKEGESIITLDNKEVKFKNSNMVIADTKNVLAVAGIKGGKIAEVDNNTKNIILEVANFDPISVRKTAQDLNIFTDARKRFENDLSSELASYAMREFSALILEMCPDAIFEDVVDIYPQKQEIRELSFSADRISKILGLSVSVDKIKDILKKYNFKYKEEKGDFEIVVPQLRLDLQIEEDMAEEIGRILGYDKIKEKVSKINFKIRQNEIYVKTFSARTKLLNDGYSEIMNSTFRNTGEISVLASASDKKFLRTNLTDGLKESLKLNLINTPLLGVNEIKIFEIGTVFKKTGEEMHVAYGDKKEIKEMKLKEFFKKVSSEFLREKVLPLENLRQDLKEQKFKMWSLFPFIARDIAVWVPEDISCIDVEKIIKENIGDMVIKGPELFDEFKKDGKISYAFRLVFQSYDRTLIDTEVNDIMTKISNKIKDKNGWQVR
ncbi:MAG: phenylalanine--tRNA ligase subunit beta [Candidatus Paceibacterota bacterium]